MADPSYYGSRDPHASPYPPLSDMSHEEDYKASYDDLIDGDATQFAPNARHQTVAVNPMSTSTDGPQRPRQLPQSISYALDSNKQGGWDYPPTSVGKEQGKTSFWARWIPDSIPCRLFVAVVLLETMVDLLLEGELLLQFDRLSDASTSTDKSATVTRMPVYLSVFAFAHIFQLIMAVNAVYARNTLQFMFLIVFNALFLAYAGIQIVEVQQSESELKSVDFSTLNIPISTLTRIIPVVIGLSEAAFIALGWKIYNEFGWKVYKYIGADRRLKKMYTNYQVFQCLVKFDVFFFVGFCVQFIGLVLTNKDWEYYVTCAALPLSVLLLIEGHLAARHENKWMMATFMSGCVGAMVYFVYKLYHTLVRRDDNDFKDIWKSLAIFSVLDILLLVPTFVLACMVMANFGRGLKDQLDKSQKTHGRWRSQGGATGVPASSNPRRMSID